MQRHEEGGKLLASISQPGRPLPLGLADVCIFGLTDDEFETLADGSDWLRSLSALEETCRELMTATQEPDFINMCV